MGKQREEDVISNMKRILFVIGNLRVGGVPKALIELLRNIEEKYDISLLCFDHQGSFFLDVPKSVKILPTNHVLELTERSASEMKSAGFRYCLLRYFLVFIARKISRKLAAQLLVHMVGKIEGEFDIAISYAHPMPDAFFCNLGCEIVLDCINARKKAAFIHCNFSEYGGNTDYNRWLLQQFDKIATVSNSVGKDLVSCIPDIKEKVMTIRNCHDFETIRQMAAENPVEYEHEINFVTIARLSEEKGILRCIPAFTKAHESGKDVGWTIVGDGPLKQRISDTIKAKNAEGYINLAGEHTNSYRYIKNADYLLLPSYHEAAPMVFDEAASLGVPIITTKTLSAIEMVADRKIGIVCENTDKDIYEAIMSVTNRPRMNVQLSNGNEEAVKEFLALCEG